MATITKATYGLVSRTIINVLANDEISRESISIFSMYMHWAIIMGYPGNMEIKKQLVADILQRITEQFPEESSEENIQKTKILLAEQKSIILEIYSNSIAADVAPTLQWSKKWQQHCAALFNADASPETCFQLFFVLKDSLKLDSTEQFSIAYLIKETMRDEPTTN